MEVLYRTDMAEGTARYGEKFKNGKYLSRKHAAATDVDGCTPWHNGYVFLTAHAAFNLEFEQALQAVDKSVSCWLALNVLPGARSHVLNCRSYSSIDLPSGRCYAPLDAGGNALLGVLDRLN